MEQAPKTSNRKKFLLWGAALISAVTLSKYFFRSKTNTEKKYGENNKVKMLTRDGKLVEIDKILLTSSGKKISNEELQKWVKR
jgi:hypothetical protein